MDKDQKKNVSNPGEPDDIDKIDDTHTEDKTNAETNEVINPGNRDSQSVSKPTQSEILNSKFEAEFTQMFSGFSSEAKQKKIQTASEASPVQPSLLEKAMSAFTNMHLAHEISIDADYKIVLPEKKDDMESRVAEIMRRAFWDRVEEDLNKSPPDYEPAIAVFVEIRDNLLTLLLPHNASIRLSIETVLDVDQIKKEVEHDALDFMRYVNFVVDCLAKLCSPLRDEQVEAIRHFQKPSEIFRHLFDVMDLMHLDMANFFLSIYRPKIMEHCASYERQKFVEFLEMEYQMTRDGMRNTREWLLRHKVAGRDTPTTIAKAFGEVISWRLENPWPETLVLDDKRILNITQMIRRATMFSSMSFSIVETCKPLFPKNFNVINTIRADLDTACRILLPLEHMNDKAKLIDDTEACAEEYVRVVNMHLLAEEEKEMSQEVSNHMRQSIKDTMRDDNKVRSLLTMRIVQYVEENVLSESKRKVPLNPGLAFIQDEVETTTREFCRIVMHNRNAYNQIYVDIIEGNGPNTIFNTNVQDPVYIQYLTVLKGNRPNTEKSEVNLPGSSQVPQNSESRLEQAQANSKYKNPPPSTVVSGEIDSNISTTATNDSCGRKHPRTISISTPTESDLDSSSVDLNDVTLEKKSKTSATPSSESILNVSEATSIMSTDPNPDKVVNVLWLNERVEMIPSECQNCIPLPMSERFDNQPTPVENSYSTSYLVSTADKESSEDSVPGLLQDDNSSDESIIPYTARSEQGLPCIFSTFIPQYFRFDNPMLSEMVVDYEAHKASCDHPDHICNPPTSEEDSEGRLDVEATNCKNTWSVHKEEIYRKWREPSEGRVASDQIIEDDVLDTIIKAKVIAKVEESQLNAGKNFIACVNVDNQKKDGERQKNGGDKNLKQPPSDEAKDN